MVSRKKLSEPVLVETPEQEFKVLMSEAKQGLKRLDKILERTERLEESLNH